MHSYRALIAVLAIAAIVALMFYTPHLSSTNESSGDATVIISLNYGERVIKEVNVSAGSTALDALKHVANVSTAYGGSFVKGINGIEGNSSYAWFYYINGMLANVGAGKYILHAGDVMRWDFHRWKGESFTTAEMADFPEPLVHGYGGKVYPTAIIYDYGHFKEANMLKNLLKGKVPVKMYNSTFQGYQRCNLILVGYNTSLARKLNSMHSTLGLRYYMENNTVMDKYGKSLNGAFAEMVQSPFNPSGTWSCENVVVYIAGNETYMDECIKEMFSSHRFWVFAGDD